MVRRLSTLALAALAGLLIHTSRADAAVTAFITLDSLIVQGDDAANSIMLRVKFTDPTKIEVSNGAAMVGEFPRAQFTSILVQALGGNDTILISREFGEITQIATLNGGAGNDTITGGAANDIISGGPDADRIIWNVGDGSDTIDGNDGADVLEINGTNGDDSFAVLQNGSRVRIERSFDTSILNVGTVETLSLKTLGGDDSVVCQGNLAALVTGINADLGAGNDTFVGSNGPDVVIGGDGDDAVIPLQGADTAFLGAGNDTFQWSPGGGNDVVEGQAGNDTLLFSGDPSSEQIAILKNGSRVLVTRDVGGPTATDLNGVERYEFYCGNGNDIVTASASLAGTAVQTLYIEGGDGNDTLTGSDTPDELIGGDGVDTINGGGGNDLINPGAGNDGAILGGPGDDTFVWDANDGSENMDGEAGTDRFDYTGLVNDPEIVAIALSLSRVVLSRDVGAVTVSLGTIERITVFTDGGADIVNVGPNLTGVVALTIDLGVGNDTLNTVASSTITVDGGAFTDTLNFDAQNQAATTTASTIAVGGTTRVTHSNFENFTFPNAVNPPPTITITGPSTNPSILATTFFLRLEGTAADTGGGIASVSWVNDRGGSGLAEGTTSWAVPNLPLAKGFNQIRVTATDTDGNVASDLITIQVNRLTYTMAEGATGGFFDTDILIANPNTVVAPITITYLKGDGSTIAQTMDLPATSRTTIAVDGIAGLENAEVSSTVTSMDALPLVVERTMRWDSRGYGAHTERATDSPTKTWYFAEGSQGFFQTFVLLANPGSVSNDATITFLLEGGAPVVKTFTLAPTSRQTIDAGSVPELVNQSFGIVVSFTQPGVAERAMYFSTPNTPIFNAGHESAGVNAPATSWFLAEGATGSFFTTFVLLANPGGSDATATVTFLPANGSPVTKSHVVQAGRRVTLNIAAEHPSLADAAVATQVTSTQPILVERAQYWPFSPTQWYEAHNSFGGTALGTKWGLAEGRVGGPEAYQTYILLANANTQAANVSITFLRTTGSTVTKPFTVPAQSRFNVHVNGMVPELTNESFGAVVEVTSGPGIFVERALYSDAEGVVFAAGTNALATRLP